MAASPSMRRSCVVPLLCPFASSVAAAGGGGNSPFGESDPLPRAVPFARRHAPRHTPVLVTVTVTKGSRPATHTRTGDSHRHERVTPRDAHPYRGQSPSRKRHAQRHTSVP